MLKHVFFLVFILSSAISHASVFQMYGYGARNVALANGTSAHPTDAFSFQYNPALMGWQPKPLFSAGTMFGHASFNQIQSVIVDTPALGADTGDPVSHGFPVANVDTSVPDTFLFEGAAQFPLTKSERPFHLGVDFSIPVQKAVGAETQDPFVPQYSMYLSDSQRLAIGTAIAYRPIDMIGIGVGANIFLVQGATTRLRLPSSGTSTGVFKADIKPAASLTAGVVIDPHPNFMLGFAWQDKSDVRADIDALNELKLFTPTPIILHTKSSIYYDPQYFEMALRFHDGDFFSLSGSARLEKWSEFNGSVMRMSFETFTSSFQQVLPDSSYHDVISWHLAVEKKLGGNAFRGGYQYKPSPTPNTSYELNYLDSDRHIGSVGWGRTVRSFFGFFEFSPIALDVVGFYQYLVPRTVVKAIPNVVGYPGYRIAGSVYGAVVSITSEL